MPCVNAQIDQVADSIASVAPAKIMLTLHHEPEPDVSPGTSSCSGLKGSFGSPSDYRAMWRNIEGRFAARGVTNVVWVMNYMSYQNWDCLLPELWPGNDLVDWVMFDPYNSSTSHSWSASVGRFYNLLTAKSDSTHDYLSKPWGLAEFGVGGSTTQAQAYSYYDAARASVEANQFPRLKAYIALDADGTTRTRTSYSVAGVLDPVEQQHFNALANSPAFLQGDTTAPTVHLTSPSDGSSVQGDVLISATASDSIGVAGVTYALDGGGQTALTAGPGGTATATWDSSSVADGRHDLVVTASDAAGNTSTATASITVANLDTTPPSTPGSLKTRSISTDTVDLTWAAASDDRGVAGYRLTRDGTDVWSGTATRFVDTSVQPGTDYVYEVTALDAAGNTSPESAMLLVHTPETADTVPPSTPELSAQVSGDDVQLSWTDATDDTGVNTYEVLRDGTVIGTVNGSTNTFVDADVEQARPHEYAVRALDLAGNAGEATPVTTVTVPDSTAPSTPGRSPPSSSSHSAASTWTGARRRTTSAWPATASSATAHCSTACPRPATWTRRSHRGRPTTTRSRRTTTRATPVRSPRRST